MNFNIANLGSLPSDHMPVPGGQLDIAALGMEDDDHFAHILRDQDRRDVMRDQDRRDDQADFDAKERDAVSSRDGRSDRAAEDKQVRSDTAAEKQNPERRDTLDETKGSEAERPERQDHRENENAADERPGQDEHAARNDDEAPARQNEGKQDDLPSDRGVGEQTADAARTDAASRTQNQHAADTLLNLVNGDGPERPQAAQAIQPATPDALAANTLPNPMPAKPITVDAKADNAGKVDPVALKPEQAVQTKSDKSATPRLRGGQPKHGGDFMAEGLPRPQTNQLANGNTASQPMIQNQRIGEGPQPAGMPADQAANVATATSSQGGNAVRELQLTVTPERTGRAELPVLTLRNDAPATPTNQPTMPSQSAAAAQPLPQPVVSQAMEGDGGTRMLPPVEDSGKASNGNTTNNASSTATSTTTSATAKAAAATQQTATADVRSPGIQVAMQLSKAIQNGIDRVTIRLDPAELGRVEVKMEVGHDGRVIALVAAERPETLEALRNDSRSLERALQEAGLETDADSLNFSLDQGGQQGGALEDETGGGKGGGLGNEDGEGDEELAGDDDVLPQIVSNRALDISV